MISEDSQIPNLRNKLYSTSIIALILFLSLNGIMARMYLYRLNDRANIYKGKIFVE
jgi:hypothetical protein